MALIVTGNTFDAEVLKQQGLVMVDFFAEWCGPCKALAPVVEELSKVYAGKCKVCKVNIDDAQDLAGRYGVMSVPTVIFFKAGKKIDQFIGALPRMQIEKYINRNILAS